MGSWTSIDNLRKRNRDSRCTGYCASKGQKEKEEQNELETEGLGETKKHNCKRIWGDCTGYCVSHGQGCTATQMGKKM